MAKRSKADVKHAIDLLWSHQIRRENAALHKEVKRLQQQVDLQIDEARELRTVSEKATAVAQTAIACVEKALADQTNLQTTVEDAHRQAQGANDKIAGLEHSLQDGRARQTEIITHFNQDIDKLKADLARFQDQHKLDFNQAETSIQQTSMALENKWESSELADLQARIDHIEDFLQQGINVQSVSRIEDSVDEQQCGGYANKTDCLVTLEKSPRTYGRPLPHDENDETEPMLTLRDAIDRDESTEVEEIDLDKNVTTMSYAKNMKRGVPVSDSLVMLPQRDSHLTQADVLEPLKQGRFHSWDRYFTEGQALVKRHPRKLEFSIVKSFIAGLYATKQREQCVQWLELNGWTWESVAGFGLSGTPCVPVYQDSVDPGALVGPNEAAEKVVKSPITQDSTPTIARQSKKKVKGGSTGKPNPKTRSSQRLRNQSQVTKSVHQPRNTKQDKTPVATLPRSRSQRAPTKTATPRRDASGRFLRQRSSSPAIAARSSQASARGSIANGKKGLSRKAAKMGEHASSLKQAKVRAAEQEAIAVPTVLNAGIDVEPVQAAPQRPTTPPRQPSPSQGPEQTVPRLIRRRKSVDRVSEVQARKRRRLMDEQGLPPLSPQSVQPDGKESGRKRKRRRLPLPPPPEIPIMPTSDE